MNTKSSLLRLLLILAIAGVCGAGPAAAMDITASGTWSQSTGRGDLVAGAGSDLISSYESESDQALVSISAASSDSDTWRVDIRRSDTFWHGNLVLSARRTGDGMGGGEIIGGLAYQPVGAVDSALFAGAGDRIGIPLQLEISGVSVQIPPGAYSTSVIFTVVDTQ